MSLVARHVAGPLRPRGGFTLRDVVVLVFLASLLPFAHAVVAQRSREPAYRIKCATNLRQIGQAMAIYASLNGGNFPRTIFDETASPVPSEYTAPSAPDPFAPGGPGPNDVTASLFLLLRTTDITSEPFVCPNAVLQWDVSHWPGDPLKSSNFPGRAHLSYACANPYPSAAALSAGFKWDNTLGATFAVAADMGPGQAASNVPQNSPRTRMLSANSPNHAGDGQNVLYADGHVDWHPSPFCGSQRPGVGVPKDNIYTHGLNTTPAAKSGDTYGAPQDDHDSVLLPGADAGPQPSGATPAEREHQRLLHFLGVGAAAVIAIAVVIALARRRRATPAGGQLS